MKYRLAAILCACCLVIGVAGCGATAEKTGKSSNSESKTEEKADVEKSENEISNSKESEEEQDGRQVVTGGFQFTLPENITPLVNGEGLILSDENMNYQMLVDVRSYSFDLKKETPDFFAQKVNEAGYKITRDVEVVEIAKREYAYFNYLSDGDNMLLAYSKADDTKTFATLIQRYGDLSDEELLTQVADILATAQKTDLPNTTMDDIVEDNAKNSDSVNSMDEFTEKVDTVDLVIEENKFTVSVPEDFYMIKEDEPSETTKLFTSADGETNVSLYLVENISGEKPEAWVKDSISIPEDAEKVSKSGVLQEELKDAVVYYQIVSYEQKSSYKDETNTYLEMCAVCQVADGIWLELQADSTRTASLNFDAVKDFFTWK